MWNYLRFAEIYIVALNKVNFVNFHLELKEESQLFVIGEI